MASHYYNNTIATLRLIIQAGIREHKEAGGTELDNPAAELQRVRVKQKELKLPESAQFKTLVENIRTKSGGWGPSIADLVEFLAYGGMRIHSEAAWVTWEDVDWKRNEIIVRGDPITATKNSELRRVPILPDMEVLLKRLKEKLGTKTGGQILKVGNCQIALTRACKDIGISRITQHDLRHWFATRCIESGVDIPTVSRWLWFIRRSVRLPVALGGDDYSIQESADMLGVNYFSVYRLIQRGKLKACRALRGKLLVPRTELLKLLKTE